MYFELGLLLILVRNATGECCGDNWIRQGNSCYMFVGKYSTWFEASTVCGNHGAELASIQSLEEDQFIKGFLNGFAALGASMRTWLGGTDRDTEGIWKWAASGEKFTYTSWYPGQPELPDGGDCLALFNHNSLSVYTWGDYRCHKLLSFICEKTLSTNPVVG